MFCVLSILSSIAEQIQDHSTALTVYFYLSLSSCSYTYLSRGQEQEIKCATEGWESAGFPLKITPGDFTD